jgi:hypothetical protein
VFPPIEQGWPAGFEIHFARPLALHNQLAANSTFDVADDDRARALMTKNANMRAA